MAVLEPRFVNREEELSALRSYCSSFRSLPLYIYGPEGCGKTRLLREFVKKFNEFFGENSIAIYIDAMEERDIKRALLASISKEVKLFEIGLDVVKDLVQTGVPLGQALSRSISYLIDKVAEKLYKGSLRDKYVLVVVDDVARAIGLDRIEWYVKWLYELMWKIASEYKPKAINIIATTSEGTSRKLVGRHSHAGIELIWNLDKKAFKELFYELDPPNNISFNDIWRLLGGNPRKLIELAKRFDWNIEAMISDYTKRMHSIVTLIIKEGLRRELELVLEDIDSINEVMSKEMRKLEELLEENNLILYKYMTTITRKEVSRDPEIGIGKYYAWQTPLYREVIEKIILNL